MAKIKPKHVGPQIRITPQIKVRIVQGPRSVISGSISGDVTT
jgi:hypothetical protein